MTTQTNNSIALVAHAVRKFETEGKEKGAWSRIGIAFPHPGSEGFSLKLELLPWVGQDIVLLPRDEDRDSASVGETRLIVYAVHYVESAGKKFWTRVGVAFPNAKGGYHVKLELLPMVGQDLVLLPPRNEQDAAA